MQKVKAVYADLKIADIYHAYEEESYKRIRALIDQIDEELLPKDMFIVFMNR